MMPDTSEEWGEELRRIRFDEARRNECNTPGEQLTQQRQRTWIRTALRFAQRVGAPLIPPDLGGEVERLKWRVRFFFAWFDFWVGWYYDRKKRILYVCPLPMVVLAFDFGRK